MKSYLQIYNLVSGKKLKILFLLRVAYARQNKKGALLEFLFGGEVTRMGSDNGRGDSYQSSSPTVKILEDQIQALQKSYDGLRSQVESLQQKVIQLESKLMTALRFGENPKYALIEPSRPLESSKTIPQGIISWKEKRPLI